MRTLIRYVCTFRRRTDLVLFGLALLLTGSLAPVRAHAAPGSRVFVLNSGDATLSVLASGSDQLLATLPIGSFPADQLAASPDGAYLFVANTGENSVTLVRTADDRATTIPVGAGPFRVAPSPDGRQLFVTNSGDGTLSVIDVARQQVNATIPLGSSSPATLAVSPDGRRVYVTSLAGSMVSVVDVDSHRAVGVIDVGSSWPYPRDILVSADGQRLFVANPGDSAGNVSVSVIDTSRDQVTAVAKVVPYYPPNPVRMVASPDGLRLYVLHQISDRASGGFVAVLDTRTNRVAASVPVGHFPQALVLSPDARRIYVTNQEGTVSVLDTSQNRAIATVSVGSSPLGIAVSPDGSRIYVSNEGDGTLSVLDAATNQVETTLRVGAQPRSVLVEP